MSAISTLRFAESGLFEASLQPLDEREKKADAAAGLAALPGMSASKQEQQLGELSRWAKPAAGAAVTMQAAAKALERVFERLGASRPHVGLSTLHEVEKQPMETLMLAATMLSVQALGDVASAKGKALEIMSDKQEQIRAQEIKELREQMDKAIEQQQKAKKAGIFGAVFDWIVAAVEVVSGIAKIVGGVLTGNAMTVAGGVMDLMAGTAGLVKAVANTLALIDTAHADKYKSIAETAGKIQLAFEVIGAAIDITSAARNMVVTKVIPKAAETTLREGAEQALVAAVKTGSKDAVAKTAQEIGKKVASEVSEQVLENLGKGALEAWKKAGKEAMAEATRQLGVNRVLDAFSSKAIEEMVTKAVKEVAEKAIERGVEVTAKELTKDIVKQIRREVIAAVLKSSALTAVNVTRAVAGASSEIASGAIGIERANLKKEIDMLILDQQWLQAFFQFYDEMKKDMTQRTKHLLDDQSTALAGGVKAMNETAAVQVRGAASMAHVAAAAI
ncbi:MAG TPA: type III secretion system translocon subunit SctE [Trinickia sp.]|jgi:secreted effector protein SseC|nr:type III secretion system translocon subunit SctE [Trinickia sp.]